MACLYCVNKCLYFVYKYANGLVLMLCFCFSYSDGTKAGQWLSSQLHSIKDNMKDILPNLLASEFHCIRCAT